MPRDETYRKIAAHDLRPVYTSLGLPKSAFKGGGDRRFKPFDTAVNRGTAAQRTDVLGSHLDIGMVSLSEVPELHGTNTGELSKARSPSLPGVPTGEEAGVPVIMTAERGFALPKGAPDDVAKKLESAIAESLRDPDYVKSSPGDAPVLAFMPGAEWQKRLDEMTKALQPLAGELTEPK